MEEIHGVTKLKYIIGLFRKYFKSLNLEEKSTYVFWHRINVIFDNTDVKCKLIRQVAPPAVAVDSKLKLF